MNGECRNCGSEVYAKGRCRLCYVYWRKHGTERPERLWIAYGLRITERRLTRELWAPYLRG